MKIENDMRITVIGMSGVGKTTISSILSQAGWYHYSSDLRIGTYYLEDEIIADLVRGLEKYDEVKELLGSGTLSVVGKVTMENLYLLSRFVGKIGNPEQDGLSHDEFRRRQELYHKAEIGALRDVPAFIAKSAGRFVHDSSGSLCELPDKEIDVLAKYTPFLYIQATQEDEALLLERAKSYPKPLFYPKSFFEDTLKEYMKERSIEYVALVDPDDFCRWVFPRLFYSRIPKYERIAHRYGWTVSSEEVRSLRDAEDFNEMLQGAVRKKASVECLHKD